MTKILLVVHGFPPAASGGTEAYAGDLAAALARQGDAVTVLTREADPQRPELSVRRRRHGGAQVVAINNNFQACASFEESYTHPELRRVAASVVADVAPDVAHVQHLTCLSIGLLEDLKRAGVPVVMTLNDYWLICHRGQLFNRRHERCDGPFDGGCRQCIPAGMLAPPSAFRAGRLARGLPIPGAAALVRAATTAVESLAPAARTRSATVDRLRHMRDAARLADVCLAPSPTLMRRFEAFGLPSLRACEQGIDLAPFKELIRRPSPVLRLGFAGSIIPSKGLHVLLDAIDLLAPGSVTLDVIGAPAAYHGDTRYAKEILGRLGHPAVRRLGAIPHDRIAAALADVDVVVVPSIWVENAPFIIREAFAARAPVVASNLGGMADMVRDGVNGRLFSAGDATALAGILRALSESPEAVQRLRAGIATPLSIEEDAANCSALYASLVVRRAAASPGRRADRPDRARCAAVVLNYRTPDQTRLAVMSLVRSRVPPDDVVVVDNGSGDDSAAALKRDLPDSVVIAEPVNRGFSAGTNAGIREAIRRGAAEIVLVNSDAVLAPGALGTLRDALASDTSIGIAAPVLLSREEPDRAASAGISFSHRSARMRHHGAGVAVSRLPAGNVQPVDAVSGCVMLIRRAVLDRIGGFDDEYFFSFEDIDFCLRARDAGFRTVVVQEAIAYHEGGRSIGRRSARRVYFATRNHLRLATARIARPTSALLAPLVIGYNLAYVLLSPEAPLVGGVAAVARGAWHHLAGRYGGD